MKYYIKRNNPNHYWGGDDSGSVRGVKQIRDAKLYTYDEAIKIAEEKKRVNDGVSIVEFDECIVEFNECEEDYNRAMEIL